MSRHTSHMTRCRLTTSPISSHKYILSDDNKQSLLSADISRWQRKKINQQTGKRYIFTTRTQLSIAVLLPIFNSWCRPSIRDPRTEKSAVDQRQLQVFLLISYYCDWMFNSRLMCRFELVSLSVAVNLMSLQNKIASSLQTLSQDTRPNSYLFIDTLWEYQSLRQNPWYYKGINRMMQVDAATSCHQGNVFNQSDIYVQPPLAFTRKLDINMQQNSLI